MDATVELFDAKRREFHLDRYRFAAARVKGLRVLDCACGTGYGVRLLHELGSAAQLVGVDIVAASAQYGRRYHGVGSAWFVCAAGERLPLRDASIDIVTSFETVEHVPDDYALVEEFHRVLRPEGKLIVSTPNRWPLADAPFHVREYDRASFVSVLASRFDCLEFYNQNSGSDTPFNHNQARGIVVTTLANENLAECYIAVCQRKA